MDFMNVMNERFAAKSFSDEKISKENLDKVIEFGRLSPSSLGLEPWKFVVVSNQELKDKLVPACFGQTQVGQASEVVIILNNRKNFAEGSTFLADTFNARLPEDIAKKMIPTYQGFLDNMDVSQKDDWSKRQCFIAAANMMTGAKSLGIDSCPMEGFVEDKVLEVLDVDSKEFGVAMVIPFGFADKPGYPKTRFPVEQVVEFK